MGHLLVLFEFLPLVLFEFLPVVLASGNIFCM